MKRILFKQPTLTPEMALLALVSGENDCHSIHHTPDPLVHYDSVISVVGDEIRTGTSDSFLIGTVNKTKSINAVDKK